MNLLPGLVLAIVAMAPESATSQTLSPPKRLPISGLAPAVYVPDLCLLQYPAGTRSEDCQRFCDQALGYFYSYVWIEAVRSFETALEHDPECAFAWLGLHRSLEKWGKSAVAKPDSLYALGGGGLAANLPDRFNKVPATYALEQAKNLLERTNPRVNLLVNSKLHEKGMIAGTKPEERAKKAREALDELITLYPEDEEGWYARALLGEGKHGKAPFYKALLRINPVHPGANHELVHFFENIRRPGLGWVYAQGYMNSSPKLPHAFHMQAHLAMRIGKWQHTTDWSRKAYEMQKEYHRVQGVKPSEDHQFVHHMETLTRSLVHDGRFPEASTVKEEARKYGYNFRPEWFRMAVTQQDWEEAEKLVAQFRKVNKAEGAYYAAVLALERGEADRARAEIDVLKQSQQSKKTDRRTELRLNELLGRYECMKGNTEAGLKLLKRTIDKTKDDYAHHAWAGGAYYMESWGVAALKAGEVAEAEEAFQEALAHDTGSVRGALGMWALCERLGRTDEAARYLKVAQRCWNRAEPKSLQMLQTQYVGYAKGIRSNNIATNAQD